MPRPPSRHPTDLELEILKILWRDGPLPVRQTRQALAGVRPLAHTSVMTVMNIMIRKGYLKRLKQDGVYVYRPAVSRKTTTRGMLRDLLRRAFDGSPVALMTNLLDCQDLDDEELEAIRRLLRGKAKGTSP